MAVPTGTLTKYALKGLREQLSDVIYSISPTDTPFMSGAGKGERCKSTLVEWQTDALASADGTNARVEGDDAAFTAPASTVRVGNYTQISDKTLILSGTAEAVDAAGRRGEEAYQLAKRGAELKRDMETIFLQAQGGDAGSEGVARKLASLNAWVKTNVDMGAGAAANPTYTAGVPLAARTDGTQRAFTETILKNVAQLVWRSGGDLRLLMTGPVNKGRVSGFTGIVTRNFDQSNVSPKPTAIIASADVFVTDFGVLRVLPNRFQRERDAWFIDFELVSVRYLRSFKTEKLAKTGDSERKQLLGEYTLQVNQEAGLGLAADLTTT